MTSKQMLNALALAFNKSGGSFQSNIDGALAVRVIQGWASQGGIMCAQLAQRGITGPKNFLEGIYGYFHLFAEDKYDTQILVGGLGKRFDMTKTLFKKYPSCGATRGSIEAILNLVQEKHIESKDVARINIKTTPDSYELCGHPFEIGDNPRVSAQFSIRYCAANALLRKSCRLHHFEESAVRDPRITELTRRIDVEPEPQLGQQGPVATEVEITTRGGVYHQAVYIPRGYPENPLSSEEHIEHFQDCVNYASKPLPVRNIQEIHSLVMGLEEVEDIRILIPLMLT